MRFMQWALVPVVSLAITGCAVDTQGIDDVESTDEGVESTTEQALVTRTRVLFNGPTATVTERCSGVRFANNCQFDTTVRDDLAESVIALLDRVSSRADVLSTATGVRTPHIVCTRASRTQVATCSLSTADNPFADTAFCSGGTTTWRKSLRFRDWDGASFRPGQLAPLLAAQAAGETSALECARFSAGGFGYVGGGGTACAITIEHRVAPGCQVTF